MKKNILISMTLVLILVFTACTVPFEKATEKDQAVEARYIKDKSILNENLRILGSVTSTQFLGPVAKENIKKIYRLKGQNIYFFLVEEEVYRNYELTIKTGHKISAYYRVKEDGSSQLDNKGFVDEQEKNNLILLLR